MWLFLMFIVPSNKKVKAFTLIELLLVVALIIILTGVTLQVLNRQGIRNKAEDSVRKSILQQLAEALETHGAAEGTYPVNQAAAEASIYLEEWPTGDVLYEYSNFANNFRLVVVKASDSSNSYSYSSHVGRVITCAPNGAPCEGLGYCCQGYCNSGTCWLE